MLLLMLSKDFEDKATRKKKPYKRAVEKRLYFQEYITTVDNLEEA